MSDTTKWNNKSEYSCPFCVCQLKKTLYNNKLKCIDCCKTLDKDLVVLYHMLLKKINVLIKGMTNPAYNYVIDHDSGVKTFMNVRTGKKLLDEI